MRLIDADALIEFVEGRYTVTWNHDYDGGIKDACIDILNFIDNAPTIDPVRHGRWEVIDAEEPRRYGCSECKRLSWHMENYCGNCGAKMDGEDDE